MVYSLLLSSPHIMSTLSLSPPCLSTVQILNCHPTQVTVTLDTLFSCTVSHYYAQYCTLIKSHLTTWIETQDRIIQGTCLQAILKASCHQHSPFLILLVSTMSVREVAGGGEMSHSHSSLKYQPEMRVNFRRNQDMSTQLEI